MKTIKILFVAIICSLASVSCLVDDEAPGLEFTATENAIGFKKADYTAAYFTNAGDVEYSLHIDAIGGGNNTLNSSRIIGFEIDPSSTAVAGTEYELVTSGGSTQLVEGSNFADINFIIKTANLSTTSTSTIVVNIISTDNGIIAETKKQATITLAGLCPSDLAGNYDWNGTAFTIVEIGDGLYEASYLPLFTTHYWWQFQDVCDNLTITDFQFQGSNPASGTGTVLPNGDLSFTGVTVAGAGYNNQSWIVVKQ